MGGAGGKAVKDLGAYRTEKAVDAPRKPGPPPQLSQRQAGLRKKYKQRRLRRGSGANACRISLSDAGDRVLQIASSFHPIYAALGMFTISTLTTSSASFTMRAGNEEINCVRVLH